ncbi:helix-turn-helix domain-containing protein [Blautia liquoris]|uniref:Stage 0 sporulation protein A homolog n=1 Tax=Blautia liquoris TaxID=2779518 RepID=A0A7M2RK05_9FIRM|nr:helix-turn-helix domain-containing protein [Blautia liquoris]QOV19897.1 helix-turn-helix domain-containing protein [Blautia liquoris]
MRTVLIVDDENLIRIGIMSMIDWEENGYQILGDTGLGEEAIRLIGKLKPDIVLTDLKMDPVDGFEVIKKGLSISPKTRFLVLSNYNDLETTRSAIRLGASDYIFKLSIDPENLLKVMNEISRVEPVIQEQDSNETRVKTYFDWEKENAIKHIVDYGENPEQALSDICIRTNFEHPYMVLFLRMDNLRALRQAGEYKDLLFVKKTLEQMALEIFGRQFLLEIFRYGDAEMVLMVNERYSNSFCHVERAFTVLNNYAKQNCGFSLSGGCSSVCLNLGAFRQALLDARRNARDVFMPYEDMITQETKKNTVKAADESCRFMYLEADVKQDNISEALKILLKYMEDAAFQSSIPGSCVKQKILEYLQVMMYGFIKIGYEKKNLVDKNGISFENLIYEYDTLLAVKTAIEEIALKVENSLNEMRKEDRLEVTKAKYFTKEHLHEEISVKQAASYVHMSESRFSHIFKEDVGISYIDYVNQMRIARAKTLLKGSDSIYEIAFQVGILNPNYFSTLFKKYTGISPMEYRRKK